MKRLLTLPLAAAALVLAPAAQAHVTVHPNVLPTGQFVQLVVRVPSERPDADTTRVDVQLPPGFIFVSYAPVPGWTVKIVNRKLSQPVTVFGEQHDEEVGQVIWSGGKIAPGEFIDFPLSVSLPNGPPGARLTFKALQTYSGGEVVRWIGAPSSESPAPQIVLAAKNAPAQDVPAGPAAATAAPAATTDDEEGDDSTATVAVILGAVGAVAGIAALAIALFRRRTA
jgi:uncharacterized protein YcnI